MKIICLIGKNGVGKNTTAKILEKYGYKRLFFELDNSKRNMLSEKMINLKKIEKHRKNNFVITADDSDFDYINFLRKNSSLIVKVERFKSDDKISPNIIPDYKINNNLDFEHLENEIINILMN